MSCEKIVAKEKTQEPSPFWNPKQESKVTNLGLRPLSLAQGFAGGPGSCKRSGRRTGSQVTLMTFGQPVPRRIPFRNGYSELIALRSYTQKMVPSGAERSLEASFADLNGPSVSPC